MKLNKHANLSKMLRTQYWTVNFKCLFYAKISVFF